MTQQYDAIIIGSGQAGGPLSTALARAGYRTALVEREHVGGTCINEGCTPTKTMVASARVAYLARRAADYGIKTGPVEIDMIRVRQRKRDIVDSFRSSSERRITGTPGVDLLRGEARFVAPKTVRVDGDELTAERIFINTGARPSRPPIAGLDSVPSLDSTSIMELDTVPEHLIVLGGGYVGLEFGQMFRRFGSQVTIVQRGPRLLSREDGDVADAVADILRQDGVSVCLETDVLRVEPGIRVLVRSTAGERSVVGSHRWWRSAARPILTCSICRQPESSPTNRDSCQPTIVSRRRCRVSMPLATSRVAPRSPTSPTTTTASSRPI